MSAAGKRQLPRHPNIDAILLDLDGVLLDTVHLKEAQFRAMIAEHCPAHLERAMQYYWSHGGVSRVEKFRWIFANLVQRPLADPEALDLGAEFARRVERLVLECPMLPGAAEFLRDYHDQFPCYVISGTPEPELRSILDQRGLSRMLAGVFGSPADKTRIGERILNEGGYDRARVWFVGDATTDRDAARALGIHFVGIHGAHLDPFLDGTETMIFNLRELPAVLGLTK